MKTEFHDHTVVGSTLFSVPSLYHSLKPIGMGASGIVCSSLKKTTGDVPCAIKKISGYKSRFTAPITKRPFNNHVTAKRTLRELSLLIHLRHKNVLSVQDVFIDAKLDIYLVTDFMEMDLDKLLATRKLDDQYIEYFLFQLMVHTLLGHSFNAVRVESSTCTRAASFIGQ